MGSPRRIGIVGGGPVAAAAAAALREAGFAGDVVILGEEPEPPYERAALPGDYLLGLARRDELRLRLPGDVEVRTRARVVALDAGRRELVTADAGREAFDRILLAPGAQPRRVRVAGCPRRGVHQLRRLDEADALLAALPYSRRAVVAGDGWPACEAAASLRRRGLDVTLATAGPGPLAAELGPSAAAALAQLHVRHGVRVLGGAAAVEAEGHERLREVRLADGRRLPCDLLVLAPDGVPRVELAHAAGLAVDDGILVDSRLATRAEGVFAAGAAARALHPAHGAFLRREHWHDAMRQAERAAVNMLGAARPASAPLHAIFEQFGARVELAGWASRWDEVTVRGEPGDEPFSILWRRAGRMVMAMTVGEDGAPELRELLAGAA